MNLASEVKRRLDNGELANDVASALGVACDTVQAAYEWWHESRALRAHKDKDHKNTGGPAD